MASAVMSLGDVTFEVESVPLDRLRRERRWRWVQQAPIGEFPSLTYLGPEGQGLRLHGIAYPGQLGAVDVVEQLHALGDSGEPHNLVDGDGNNWGRWVVLAVEDQQGPFVVGGAPLRIEFDVQLRRYQDEGS